MSCVRFRMVSPYAALKLGPDPSWRTAWHCGLGLWPLSGLSLPVSAQAQAQDKPASSSRPSPTRTRRRLIERFTKVAEQLQAKLGVPAEIHSREKLSRGGHGVHQQPGPACLVRRLHGRTGPPSDARRTGDRPRSRRRSVQVVLDCQRQDRAETRPRVPERGCGQILHLRRTRLHLRPPDAGVSSSGRRSEENRRKKSFRGSASQATTAAPSSSCNRARSRSACSTIRCGISDQKAGKVDPAQVSVVWESPPFPDYQWTIRGDVDATFGAGFTEKVASRALVHRRSRRCSASSPVRNSSPRRMKITRRSRRSRETTGLLN